MRDRPAGLLKLSLAAMSMLLFVAAGGVMAAQAACAPAPSGLAAWWPGEDSFEDVIGDNDGGRFVGGGAGYADGMVGRGFTMQQPSYVEIPDDPSLTPGTISVGAWFNRNRRSGSWDPVLKKTGPGQSNGYALEYRSGGQIWFWVYAPSWRTSGGSLIPPDRQWNHVMGTYDGSRVRVYINGQLSGQGSASGPIRRSPWTFRMGDDPSNSGSRHFDGQIDEPMVFNRALSAAEVRAIYDAGPDGLCTGGGNVPPTADAGPDQKILVGAEATFDGGGSSDSDGTIVSYSWDFGDTGSGSGQTATHAYLSPGTFTATLTVEDDDAATGTDTAQVTVQTPEEALAELGDAVDALPGVPSGLKNALASKLDNALDSLARGNETAGANQIRAFMNHVNAQRGKKLTDEQADELIAAAQAILDALGL
ncbi:MAG: LamG-like jellyroll fold domain-containing protein [Elusimicrobiota bacterium]